MIIITDEFGQRHDFTDDHFVDEAHDGRLIVRTGEDDSAVAVFRPKSWSSWNKSEFPNG